MSKPIVVTEDNFDEVVLASPIPVLVDFWAKWCPPCRQMHPIIAAIAKELDGQLRVAKLDTDEAPEITASSSIGSIPTFNLYRDGKIVHQIVGGRSKAT
ncbi:MAG: thioredoxin [Actinomycetaceae bacterium]|nr:thioredoxin [Actinomycetaceae bacterium]